MDYREEDYLMLSGIQHFAFCRRQWALIVIEQQWADNYLTIAGELLHENAHDKSFTERRGKKLITRGMPIYSRTMGISGECDVVEFILDPKNGVPLFGQEGRYQPVPIEYKHGIPKLPDFLQLTAEVMCLEEMLCCQIPVGYMYYEKTRHREKVDITEELRQQVKQLFEEMHNYYARGYTPKAKKTKSCAACSLKDICLPSMTAKPSAAAYIQQRIGEEDI